KTFSAPQLDKVKKQFGGFSSSIVEQEFSLMSKQIPFVVNPDASFEPPMFAAAIHKEGEIVGSGAIINKHNILTLCVLVKNP
ncbi:hypothetical protein ILUMI_14521, partial [Ignelater luminosus]